MPTIQKMPVHIMDGKAKTTSLEVSEIFNRKHQHVLRDIRKLNCSDEFTCANFGQITYRDSKNREYPAYEITRDGFTMLAFSFTGRQATQWKEAYINAFNAMEKELLTPELPAYYKQELLSARPLWRQIDKYSGLGLTHAEIGKLVGRHRDTVRTHLNKMELCGVIDPVKALPPAQMPLQLGTGGAS